MARTFWGNVGMVVGGYASLQPAVWKGFITAGRELVRGAGLAAAADAGVQAAGDLVESFAAAGERFGDRHGTNLTKFAIGVASGGLGGAIGNELSGSDGT